MSHVIKPIFCFLVAAYLSRRLFTFLPAHPAHIALLLSSIKHKCKYIFIRMSADWSAIRRRQTLGEVQNHAMASQIPQPSSVFKKSAAGRASVAPGSLAGLGPAPPPRTSLAPQRFYRSSSGGNLASEAAIPSAPMSSSQTSSQRDSLRNSRQSYAPQNSFK
jgi:hypothetical protein